MTWNLFRHHHLNLTWVPPRRRVAWIRLRLSLSETTVHYSTNHSHHLHRQSTWNPPSNPAVIGNTVAPFLEASSGEVCAVWVEARHLWLLRILLKTSCARTARGSDLSSVESWVVGVERGMSIPRMTHLAWVVGVRLQEAIVIVTANRSSLLRHLRISKWWHWMLMELRNKSR